MSVLTDRVEVAIVDRRISELAPVGTFLGEAVRLRHIIKLSAVVRVV